MIEFLGKAKNEWQRSHGRSITSYRSPIEIQRQSLVFEDFEITTSETQFPFSFTLPINSLPSVEAESYGRYDSTMEIHYRIKITIDLGGFFDDKSSSFANLSNWTSSQSFPIDYSPPVAESIVGDVGFCLCGSTEVPLQLTLPQRGWMIGSILEGELLIDNASNSTFDLMKIDLNQHFDLVAFPSYSEMTSFPMDQPFIQTRRSEEQSQIEKAVFSNTLDIQVKPKVTEKLKFAFKIPWIPSTFHCAIIQLMYKLKAGDPFCLRHSLFDYRHPNCSTYWKQWA
ncbi:unnamed protein product, partial [Mesorhabditis belari]|uniref:Arrestin C-terminal-like domain-containing protein n=1 Tax=Mesorhabditis belari TaxID=2138241 RepID=A0AAF3FFH1_9BILA